MSFIKIEESFLDKLISKALPSSEDLIVKSLDLSSLTPEERKLYNEIVGTINEQIDKTIEYIGSDEWYNQWQNNKTLKNDFFDDIAPALNEVVNTRYANIEEMMNSFYDAAAKQGYKDIKREYAFTKADLAALYHLNQYNFNLVKDLSEDMRKNLRATIWRGYAEGQSVKDMARSLKEAGLEPVGKMSVNQRAKLIALTEHNRALNTGYLQAMANYGVKRVYIPAHGDGRECQKCLDLIADNPYYLEDAMDILPAHPGCRHRFYKYSDDGTVDLPMSPLENPKPINLIDESNISYSSEYFNIKVPATTLRELNKLNNFKNIGTNKFEYSFLVNGECQHKAVIDINQEIPFSYKKADLKIINSNKSIIPSKKVLKYLFKQKNINYLNIQGSNSVLSLKLKSHKSEDRGLFFEDYKMIDNEVNKILYFETEQLKKLNIDKKSIDEYILLRKDELIVSAFNNKIFKNNYFSECQINYNDSFISSRKWLESKSIELNQKKLNIDDLLKYDINLKEINIREGYTVYTFDDIKILVDDDSNNLYLREIKKFYDNSNKKLKKPLKRIKLSNVARMDEDKPMYGSYVHGSDRITLYNHENNNKNNTLIHEMAHCFDWKNGKLSKKGDYETVLANETLHIDYKKANNEGPEHLNVYFASDDMAVFCYKDTCLKFLEDGESGLREDFAESTRLYFDEGIEGKWFRKFFKEKVKYLDSIYNNL